MAGDEDDAPVLWRDCGALALLAATLLALISVATFDPADPAMGTAWGHPMADVPTNACGDLGAIIARTLIDNLGIATALLIAGSGGVCAALFVRRGMNAPVLRSIGGCVALVALAAAGHLLSGPLGAVVPNLTPPVGGGGRLGAMTALYLTDHFAWVGAWVVTLVTAAAGALMVTDYALLIAGRRVVSGTARVGAHVGRRGWQTASARMPGRRVRQPFTDLDTPILIEGDADPANGKAVGEKPSEPPPEIDDPDRSPTPLADLPPIKVKTPGRVVEPPAANEDDDEEAWEDIDDDADDPSDYTELEVDDEVLQLRHDPPHADETPPPPRVKAPRKKAAPSETELLDRLSETSGDGGVYSLPPVDLLTPSDDVSYDEQLDEVRRKARLLEETFAKFGHNIRVVEIETGPVIAQYEIELEAGLRLSKITGLADDVAIGLRVPSVRIVAPIPGKNTVGIEVPNETRQVVRIRDVIEESGDQPDRMNIPVFLGQDVSGNPLVVDLAKMPHLLIAGRTGTGKSVCLNAIICSVLMSCRPDDVRMLMIDPKMVELSGYGRLPHLMHPVITDMKKAEAILAWAVDKMEERYSLLAKVGVRHINSYNDLGRDEVLRRLEIDPDDEPTDVPERLPFIVIVADEMADLMMTAGKDVEQHIIRLAQKSRAVGIHLILATQKPTVDVITGLIKSNLPARLSFQVASKTDSRVVLDENGADKLLGNGDMLFLWPGTSTLIRGQGTYLSDEEIENVCEHCATQSDQQFDEEVMNAKSSSDDDEPGTATMEQIKARDELYDSAIEVVIREGRGSCSLLQRCLGIGYGRAAKLIDYMAEDGIVGDYNGQKAREVLLTMDRWNEMQGFEPEPASEPGHADVPPPMSPAVEEEYEDVE